MPRQKDTENVESKKVLKQWEVIECNIEGPWKYYWPTLGEVGSPSYLPLSALLPYFVYPFSLQSQISLGEGVIKCEKILFFNIGPCILFSRHNTYYIRS